MAKLWYSGMCVLKTLGGDWREISDQTRGTQEIMKECARKQHIEAEPRRIRSQKNEIQSQDWDLFLKC